MIMRRLPPLNAIRTFEAAAHSLSFSAAAEALCVTHSAVSHQMRQLEDWLGCTLFVRHASGVRLTEAGQSLLQAAGQALALLETRCDALRARPDVDELVLGAPGSFLSNWLIPRLERFEAQHPELRIRLQTCADPEDLHKQHIDALIATGRTPWPRQMAVTPLFDETIGPVCAPGTLPPGAKPDLLADMTLLHTRSRLKAWPEWAETQGIDPAAFGAGRQFDHLTLLLEAAAAGLGMGIAPALLVERELAQGRLEAPFGFTACGAVFAFYVTAKRAHEPGLALLRAWLLREAADSPMPHQ